MIYNHLDKSLECEFHMKRRKSINSFQPGRAGWEKEQKSKFPDVINKILKEKGHDIKVQSIEKADFEVKKDGQVIAYLEAEFPLAGRWPSGEEFKYPTIRWPERKYEHYKQWNGFFNGKPLFMITIKGDLSDAYFMDAKTWFQKGKKEKVFDSVFYGISRNDPDLGRGLEKLADYILERIRRIYKISIGVEKTRNE